MRRVLVLWTVILTVLAFAVPAVAQPANDDLANATEVTAVPFHDVVDTSDATTEPGEPVDFEEVNDLFCPDRGTTVWYALSLGQSQNVTIDTFGSDYDTTLAVYTGTDFTDLELVDCNDDTFFGLQAALTITADAGVTYLIQVGAFGEGPGGELQFSITESTPIRGGKPVIFRSKFSGLAAEAFIDDFDEETGAFSFTGATVMDGRFQERGKPVRSADLFVSEFTEIFDEETGTFAFTEWFGFVELSRGQFHIDKKLRSASVLADVVLEGITCTESFDEEEFEFDVECTDLGTAEVTVDLNWEGVGGISKTKFKEKSSFDGVRSMFRGQFSERQADVSGGWSGDRNVDLTGAFGSLIEDKFSDFVMFRGLPDFFE